MRGGTRLALSGAAMKNRALRPDAGFTFIEVLVVMVILLVLLLIAAPPLFTVMRQGKIRGVAYETVTLMRLARMDAIKHSAQGVVEALPADPDAGAPAMLRAFSDRNSNGAMDEGEPLLNRVPLPNRVEHRAPPGGLATTFPAGRAVFQGNGSAQERGEFRFADDHGNFLEVAVVSTAGRIEVRKCRVCDTDDPTEWFAQGEGWTWEWN